MGEKKTWESLAVIVSDDDSVRAAARQFTADPEGYFTEHEDDLFQRGIEEPDDVTGPVVIIDALGTVDEVAYLDWKSPVDEVVGLLARISRVRDSGVDLEVLIDPGYAHEAPVETVVGWVNVLLAPAGVTVAILDEDSDAYPLIAVPTEQVDALIATADDLEVEIRAPRAEKSEVDTLLAPNAG